MIITQCPVDGLSLTELSEVIYNTQQNVKREFPFSQREMVERTRRKPTPLGMGSSSIEISAFSYKSGIFFYISSPLPNSRVFFHVLSS